MKILYISQYFYPEIGATTNRALANARYLAKNNEVTVLTEMPNHPKGVIFDEYKGKFFMTEKMESFTIVRFWVWTSKKKVFYTRLLFYLTFAFFGTIYTLLNARKYDRIYMTSPPLFVAFIGIATKLFYPKKKIVFEVRDLWPDSAVEMGELHNKAFIKMSYWLESQIYERAEKIVVVTKQQREKLVAKGIDVSKIEVIYNGVEPEMITLKATRKIEEMEQKKREGYFNIVHIGLLGLAQDILTLIKAADVLKKEKVHFFIIGTGPKENEWREKAKELNNITFFGSVSRDEVHNFLIPAHCGITLCHRIPLFTGAIPSKTYEYMAFELPVLLGLEGEAAEIINEGQAGVTFTPEDENDLVEKILFLMSNPQKAKELGRNGKEYVLKYFNREKQAQQIELLLKNIE